ncbi:MAG: BlaI/MecI/CopY family transcriptional regulator, partial [FCB group bacterium]|nr:BlaI/MecI/CopY family transcriptional regulator [FCB group bacterium]
KTLWERGAGTVQEVQTELEQRGQHWTYTTVQTLLKRLEGKGLIAVNKESTPHVYESAVTRENLVGQRLKDLALNLCDGAMAPLAHALVSREHFTREEIQRFRRLLDELDRK